MMMLCFTSLEASAAAEQANLLLNGTVPAAAGHEYDGGLDAFQLAE